MRTLDIYDITTLTGGKYSTNEIADAEKFTASIASGHYENFPVGSFLVPKVYRHDIYNIYAFARIADDIADEFPGFSNTDRIKLLDTFLKNLKKYCDGDLNTSTRNYNPVLFALSKTIQDKKLPFSLFERLIRAFILDSDFRNPRTLREIESYCYCSANPIGELVLRVFGEESDEKIRLSDFVCTGLQLANFWQDLSVDIANNRILIPHDFLIKYNLNPSDPDDWKNSTTFLKCMNELYAYSLNFLEEGKALVPQLQNKRLRKEIQLTINGGMKIIELSKKLGEEILTQRPKIKKIDFITLFFKA